MTNVPMEAFEKKQPSEMAGFERIQTTIISK